jgi:hypothetical protein
MAAFYRQLDEVQKTESKTRGLSPEISTTGPRADLVTEGRGMLTGMGLLAQPPQAIDFRVVYPEHRIAGRGGNSS